jgi:orotate phosphoribosyltransferase
VVTSAFVEKMETILMTNRHDVAAVDLETLGRDVVAISLLRGDFVLSSGATSSYYLDKYRFETMPDILRRISKAFVPHLPPNVDRIAGTELGAVALAAALSLETDIPFVIARKASKEYSTANLVEGALREGERVVLVEDVITTGAQAIKAAERIREAGGLVTAVLAVIDREEGGASAMAAADLPMTALYTRSSLRLG